MTSWECYEDKWFYMKYIGKMVETESLLSTCCTYRSILHLIMLNYNIILSIIEEVVLAKK
jgi:hypothetical protein